MIAAPVKRENVNAPISPLMGKSKWFAVADNEGTIKIYKNNCESGREVAQWLASLGVTKLFFQHMGANPFLLLNKEKIECFHVGSDRILFRDAILKYADGELTKVDIHNMNDYVEKGHMHRHGEE
jgi:predicted Fe-Mo cluster-binding NifX family protein